MATTKKPRPKTVAPSEPAAAKRNEPKEKPGETPVDPEVVASKSVPKKKVAQKRERIFTYHLLDCASYSYAGHNFVARRPLVSIDERLYEALKSNGRFRIDVREGGAR